MATQPDIQLSIPDVKALTASDLDDYTPAQSEAWLIEKAPILVLAEARTAEMRRAVGLHLWAMRVGLADGDYGSALTRIAREVNVGAKTLTRWRTEAETAEGLAPPSERTRIQRSRRQQEALKTQGDKSALTTTAVPAPPAASSPTPERQPAPTGATKPCPTCKGAGVVSVNRPGGTNARDRRDAESVDPKECRHPTPIGDYCPRCKTTLKRGR